MSEGPFSHDAGHMFLGVFMNYSQKILRTMCSAAEEIKPESRYREVDQVDPDTSRGHLLLK